MENNTAAITLRNGNVVEVEYMEIDASGTVIAFEVATRNIFRSTMNKITRIDVH